MKNDTTLRPRAGRHHGPLTWSGLLHRCRGHVRTRQSTFHCCWKRVGRGFGFDSLIEVTSGVALLWRLHADADESRHERVEAITLRIVGACFLMLAAYVSYDAIKSLLRREAPDESRSPTARSPIARKMVLKFSRWCETGSLSDLRRIIANNGYG